MGRIKNIPPNMASSSWATTCLVHLMSFKATLKLSPQKKDLVYFLFDFYYENTRQLHLSECLFSCLSSENESNTLISDFFSKK